MKFLSTLASTWVAFCVTLARADEPASAVPITESFIYTTPAMYLWVSFNSVLDLHQTD
jgi:hypothetical protein